MRIYFEPAETDEKSGIYATLAYRSKVRVDIVLDGRNVSFVPLSFGDISVVVELSDQEALLDKLLKVEVVKSLLSRPAYDEEIRKISQDLKHVTQPFRVLVVKYDCAVDEDPPARLVGKSLPWVRGSYKGVEYGFCIVSPSEEFSNVGTISVSGVCSLPEEALRQALLVSKWFGGGLYENLPTLALTSKNDEIPKVLVDEWGRLIRDLTFRNLLANLITGNFDETLIHGVISELRRFGRETLFHPWLDVEKVALGIIIARYGGGVGVGPNHNDIFRGTD